MNVSSFVVIITLLIFSIIIVYFLLIEYFAEKIINVRKNIPQWVKQAKNRFNLKNINHEIFQFKTTDGLLISSLLIPAKNANKGNVIFVHGIRANKFYFIEQAIFLSENGFNCILTDLRGHGESEGKYCTYGYLEKTDISLLIDHVTSKYKLPSSFGLWGHSLGAAISLQTLELDKRIGFVILEAPFSNLNLIFKEYFNRKLKSFSLFFFKQTTKKVEKKLEFSLNKVNPALSAKNISQPSILLHGTNDNKILPHHSNIIFNSLPTNNKIIYEVKNAEHNNIKEVWKDEYYNVTLTFINSYVNQFQYTN